jgi:hypothetical protein
MDKEVGQGHQLKKCHAIARITIRQAGISIAETMEGFYRLIIWICKEKY